MILLREKIKYDSSANKIYGILFEGAWLWEEYLWTILKKCGFKHPQNKKSKDGINIYRENLRYPDFYKGKQVPENFTKEEIERLIETNFILDAKYKHLEGNFQNDEWTSNFSRDDLHQLVTYLHILPAKKGALIYPFDKIDFTDKKIVISKEKNLFGLGGKIWTIGFAVSKVENYKEFKSKMIESENEFFKTAMFD